MDNNPQAFPLASYEGWDLTEIDGQPGMSLRDYFAGQAMVSVFNTLAFQGQSMTAESVAKLCYERADAMLNERSKQNEG